MAIYRSIYDGPPNNYTARRTNKRYIAIHNTANDASAEGEASYAKRRTDSVSSHYYVDSNSIVQSLDTDYRAWHAGNTEGNDHAISYEITGVNGWSRSQWLNRVAWNLLAAQIRKDCAEHNIAPRNLTVAQMKEGRLTGIITHNEMRLAWGGTTHTDPGPNFPMDYLILLLTKEDDMPYKDWPKADREALADDVANKVLHGSRIDKVDPTSGSSSDMQVASFLRWIHKHVVDTKVAVLDRDPAELAAAVAAQLPAHGGGAPTTEQLTEALRTVLREGVEDDG